MSAASSISSAASVPVMAGGSDQQLFGDFAGDIYSAHVNAMAHHSRCSRAAVDGAADSDREDNSGDSNGSTLGVRSGTSQDRRHDSCDSLGSADSSPFSHRSRSSTPTSLHGDRGQVRPSPNDAERHDSTGQGALRRTSDSAAGASLAHTSVDSESDDSDAEMAALFAAESSQQTALTQRPGRRLGILGMGNADYQPPQHRGDVATQHTRHTKQLQSSHTTSAVSAPRPTGSSSQQHPSPSVVGSSKKKIKKKKRNRKVI